MSPCRLGRDAVLDNVGNDRMGFHANAWPVQPATSTTSAPIDRSLIDLPGSLGGKIHS